MSSDFPGQRSAEESERQENEERLWQAFLRDGDFDARAELIESYLPMVQRLARRFVSRGEPYEDLVQVASVALVGAVDRFDPERGVAFGGFATLTIIGEIKKHFRDRGWAVRAPRRVQELSLRLTSAMAEATQTLGTTPTVPQVAELLGVSVEEVIEAMVANQGYRTASLDAPSPTESVRAFEPSSVELGFDEVEFRATLAPALATLSEREREIISLRFEKGASQVEIAEVVGISQMQVSRLLARTLSMLREHLGDDRNDGTS
jgi:RNA polymerase sigma-B factor